MVHLDNTGSIQGPSVPRLSFRILRFSVCCTPAVLRSGIVTEFHALNGHLIIYSGHLC